MASTTVPEIRVTEGATTPRPVSTTADPTSLPGTVERTTILAIITVVAFCSNLILLVTIGQSASLRKIHFNKHVVNIGIINLLTCILGMPMVIGYSVTSNWDYGDVMCRVLAHFIITISIAMCLAIFMINLDRVIAISDPEKYQNTVNSFKTAIMIIISWLVAILFPIPLSLGMEPTAPFENRYICSIVGGSNLDYLIALYSVCFALPSIVNILFFVYIAREALSEKEAESTGGRRRPSAVRLWPEVQSSGVVFILFLLWMVTELPYITLSSIQQYIQSDQINGTLPYPTHLDTVFVWLKFCDAFILPFVIFRWRKDIWLKFKDLMFCRKSNSVVDASPRGEKSSTNHKKRKSRSPANPKHDASRFEATLPIPTIKATKDGLHVQGNTEEDEGGDDEIFYADMNMTAKSGELDGIRTRADIERYDLNNQDEEGEETSDYETDPYSQSDPISVRSQHSRSHSNTTSDNKEFRTKAHSISVDSGTGSAPSSVKKKRRKKRTVADIPIEMVTIEQAHRARDTEHDVISSSHNNNNYIPDDEPIENNKTKSSRKTITQQNHYNNGTVENKEEDDDQVIEGLEHAEDQKATKRKKKKKKKNLEMADSETNTSQFVDIADKRIKPPARLDPIDPDVIQSSINRMATPPLRSKVPRDVDTELPPSELPPSELPPSELPPSGDSAARRARRKRLNEQHAAEDHPSVEAQSPFQPTEEKSRKKKTKSRHKSGGSDQPLMNSNSSSATVASEIRTVVHHGYQESQI